MSLAVEALPFSQIAFPMGERVLLAILCGGILGADRELHGRSAGFRTSIIICLGSMVFAYSSFLFPDMSASHNLFDKVTVDPGRIAAQVVTGLAFLGSGMMLNVRNQVFGITSAALVWACGAIGILIGFGYYSWSILFTIFLFLVLQVDLITDKFIEFFSKKSELSFSSSRVQICDFVNIFFNPGIKILDCKSEEEKNTEKIFFKPRVDHAARDELKGDLKKLKNKYDIEVH